MQVFRSASFDSPWRYIRLLASYLGRHKFSYALGIFFVILHNWIMVAIPELMQISIDLLNTLQSEENQRTLTNNLLLMLCLSCLVLGVRSLSRILFFNPGRAIERELKNDLFAKLMTLPKAYFDRHPTGGILSKVNNDINGVRMICGFGMMQIFNIFSALTFAPLKMLQISVTLTLYCLIPVLTCFFIVYFGMRAMYKHSLKRRAALENISAYSGSALNGISVIKSFSLLDYIERNFDERNATLLYHTLMNINIRTLAVPVLHYLPFLMQGVILLVGGRYVIQNDLTIGEISAFVAYSFLISAPLISLGWLSVMLQQGFIGLASVHSIFSQPEIPALTRPRQSLAGKNFVPGLEVVNLTFRYENDDEPILNTLNFTIAPGETLGILGEVGAGKTTLANCLNGYLSVPAGSVRLGGRPLEDWHIHDLREMVRVVTQDIFLFSDTVEKNIAFGRRNGEDIDKELWEEITRKSALREEISTFPQGKDTLIGEKGIMLSGGQKQRVSIARSLIEPSSLLILDNALSAVDTITELFLLKHLLQLEHCESLLIISHRAKALRFCDRILALEQGSITEQGTYDELMRKEGLFAKTWNIQHQESS